jgi:hypothetical protein
MSQCIAARIEHQLNFQKENPANPSKLAGCKLRPLLRGHPLAGERHAVHTGWHTGCPFQFHGLTLVHVVT